MRERIGEGGDAQHAADQSDSRPQEDALQRRQGQGGDEKAHRPVADLMQRFLIGQGTESLRHRAMATRSAGMQTSTNVPVFRNEKRPPRSVQGLRKGAILHDSIYTRPGFAQPYFTIS